MVIRYSIKELNAIGELVILRECIARIRPTCIDNNNFQDELEQFQKSLQQFTKEPTQVSCDSTKDDNEQLTSSVAEFFRKAQQNFYAETSIDPTKVRRLSEVEAELLGRGDDYYGA